MDQWRQTRVFRAVAPDFRKAGDGLAVEKQPRTSVRQKSGSRETTILVEIVDSRQVLDVIHRGPGAAADVKKR